MHEPALPVQPGAHKLVQSASSSLPADDVRPAEQALHTLGVLAPTSLEYLPAAQSWQSSPRPVLSPYLPASHSMHVELDVWPTSLEYFPASQSLHASSPTSALNLPCGHCFIHPSRCSIQPCTHSRSRPSWLQVSPNALDTRYTSIVPQHPQAPNMCRSHTHYSHQRLKSLCTCLLHSSGTWWRRLL